MTPPGERIYTIDVVRGVAVLGILLMNIVAFGLPSAAYLDPTAFGVAVPIDRTVWAINYVFADGKFRALFTMLFGASMVLIADRAAGDARSPGPAAQHYRRMMWLFVIGMAHAWLIWFGDILVQYSIAGMIAFMFWRAPPRALWAFIAAILMLQSAINAGRYGELAATRTAATAPTATAADKARWQARIAEEKPDLTEMRDEVAGYRGTITMVFDTRARTTAFFQTVVVPLTLPEVLGFLCLGMLLFRNGFFTGSWNGRAYAVVIVAGYAFALPVMIMLARRIVTAEFDPAIVAFGDMIAFIARPFVALAHAAVIIAVVKSGAVPRFVARVAAAGRMALSNYLATSVVATTIFYGYGLGMFAQFGRAQLYGLVAMIWAMMLLWSKPWLDRFRYGPAEWLWRSLSRWKFETMRLPVPADH